MEDGFDPLLPRVEGTVDQFDAECLPLAHNCVSQAVPEVLAGEQGGVGDDANQESASLHLVDQSIDAFFEEFWSRSNVMQGKVVTHDIKLPLDSAYVSLDEYGVNSKRFGASPSFFQGLCVGVNTCQATPNTLPLVQVAPTSTPTV